MQVHHLKIKPEYLQAITEGVKLFEIRKDDRGFKVGDILLLLEYTDSGRYTGGALAVKVTYITTYGQVDDFVVMGISKFGGVPS